MDTYGHDSSSPSPPPSDSAAEEASLAEIIRKAFCLVQKGDSRRLNAHLLSHKLDINVRDEDMCTLVMRAVYIQHARKRKRMMEMLIIKGCDVNARDAKGKTALMHAALTLSSSDVISILINTRKIDVNVQDHFGNTALVYSVYVNNPSAVQLMLTSPETCDIIDVSLSNQDAVTPVQLARKLRYDECEQFLVAASADLDPDTLKVRKQRQSSLDRHHSASHRQTSLDRNQCLSKTSFHSEDDHEEPDYEGRKLPIALRRAFLSSGNPSRHPSRQGSAISNASSLSSHRTSRLAVRIGSRQSARSGTAGHASLISSRATSPGSCLSWDQDPPSPRHLSPERHVEKRTAPPSRGKPLSDFSTLQASLEAVAYTRPTGATAAPSRGRSHERKPGFSLYRSSLRAHRSRHQRNNTTHYRTRLPPIFQRDNTSLSQMSGVD